MKLRDIVIFITGAVSFHMINHLLLPLFMTFPIDLKFMVLTATMNTWIIVINAVIVILLLWWASKLPK